METTFFRRQIDLIWNVLLQQRMCLSKVSTSRQQRHDATIMMALDAALLYHKEGPLRCLRRLRGRLCGSH